jgi:hypothetical protein
MALTSEDSVNYKVIQGDTFSLEITWTDEVTGLPIDLTGYTFLAEVKDLKGGKVLAATASLNNGITVISAQNGILDLTFTPEKTRLFPYPKCSYQLQATDQYGQNSTLIQGSFMVNAGVIN